MGSGLRINYVHDEADALAAAAAVAVNNGLEVPDFGLRQLLDPVEGTEKGNGDAADWREVGREPENTHLADVRLGRTRSGGVEDGIGEAGVFPLHTASKNAAKLVETGHVTNMAAGDLGRTTVVLDAGALSKASGPKLQSSQSLPRQETGPAQQQGHPDSQLHAFLGAFSKSHVTVAPPLVNASQVPPPAEPSPLGPLQTHLSGFPPLQGTHSQLQSQHAAGNPVQERGPVRHTGNPGPSGIAVQPPPTGPPVEEVVASPSVAAAQALSFLNDEPDPNFQPQAVRHDWEAPLGAAGQGTTGGTAPRGAPMLTTGSEMSGSVHPSPNTPLTPWEAAPTPERGPPAGDDVSRSAERKRKWDGEHQAAAGGQGDGPESGCLSDVSRQAGEGAADEAPGVGEGGGARPAVHHSREISLVDGLFLDAVAEELGDRKVRKVDSSSDGHEEVGGS